MSREPDTPGPKSQPVGAGTHGGAQASRRRFPRLWVATARAWAIVLLWSLPPFAICFLFLSIVMFPAYLQGQGWFGVRTIFAASPYDVQFVVTTCLSIATGAVVAACLLYPWILSSGWFGAKLSKTSGDGGFSLRSMFVAMTFVAIALSFIRSANLYDQKGAEEYYDEFRNLSEFLLIQGGISTAILGLIAGSFSYYRWRGALIGGVLGILVGACVHAASFSDPTYVISICAAGCLGGAVLVYWGASFMFAQRDREFQQISEL